MSRFFSVSLRARLLLLVLLAILPSLGLALNTGLEQHRIQKVQVEENGLRLARLAAGHLVEAIEGARQLLIGLAQLPEVSDAEEGVCSALFGNLLKQYPYYINLGVVDADGNLVCSALPFDEPIRMDDLPFFQRAVSTYGFAISGYQIDPVTGVPSINFAYPIFDDSGAVEGVVFAALDLTWFNQLDVEAQLPPGAELNVIDHNGRILARYPDPEKWVGRSMPEAFILQMARFPLGEEAVEARGMDHVQRLYGITRVRGAPEADVYVSIGISKEAAFGRINRMWAWNLAGLGVVGILGLWAAWFLGNMFILRRVERMVRTTNQLAAGDLGVRMGPASQKDELSLLAKSFDEMAESLEERTAQLHQVEAKYRTLVEQIPMVTYIAPMDKANGTRYISPQVEAILGYSPEEWLADPDLWLRRLHPEDCERVLGDVYRELSRPDSAGFCCEYRILSRDRRVLWIRDQALVVKEEGGGPPFLQGILFDITERKHFEEQLKSSHEQLRELAGHLEAVREEERTWIAREVHDELGQALTGLKMDLFWLDRKLSGVGAEVPLEVVQAKIQSMKDLIDTTVQTVRKIATALRPGILDSLGLMAAIEWQASDFETRTGIGCELGPLPESIAMDDRRSSAVFRIFQEILTNVARHAASTRVAISLQVQAESLVLEVHDNGRGITQTESEHGKSLGLIGMRERAALLGGEFEIRGAPGLGTTVRVCIPLSDLSTGTSGRV